MANRLVLSEAVGEVSAQGMRRLWHYCLDGRTLCGQDASPEHQRSVHDGFVSCHRCRVETMHRCSAGVIRLSICEEYGYRYWFARLDKVQYVQLLERWASMRGLHCSVPVPLIVPQAVEIDIADDPDFDDMMANPVGVLECHIHQANDSHLDGFFGSIPEATDEENADGIFTMSGEQYTQDWISQYWRDYRARQEAQ